MRKAEKQTMQDMVLKAMVQRRRATLLLTRLHARWLAPYPLHFLPDEKVGGKGLLREVLV